MAGTTQASGKTNLWIFEVVRIRRVKLADGTRDEVTVVGVHPLVVAPSSIEITDTTRSTVAESLTGAVHTLAGRALLSYRLVGTFGVDVRGFGPYVGSGPMRAERFWNEVVRLSDARTRDQALACANDITGSPGVTQRLQDFDDERDSFGVNLYDFWFGRRMAVQIQSYNLRLDHRRGAASGLESYTLALREVGPLIQSAGIGDGLRLLFNGLTTWKASIDLLNATTLAATLDAYTALPAITASNITDTVSALALRARAATTLFAPNGYAVLARASTAENLQALFGLSQATAVELRAIREAMKLVRSAVGAGRRAVLNWLDEIDVRGLADAEDAGVVSDMIDAGLFQGVAGVFFGMDRADFGVRVASAGRPGMPMPDVSFSATHRVAAGDTLGRLEDRYGISADALLSLNNLTADEALLIGTELLVPVQRPTGPQSITGLPTFDTHAGTRAWGQDVDLEFSVDPLTGDLRVVRDAEILRQGMKVLAEQEGDAVLQGMAGLPLDVETRYLQARIATLFASDRRIRNVNAVSVTINPVTASVAIVVELTAINAGTQVIEV